MVVVSGAAVARTGGGVQWGMDDSRFALVVANDQYADPGLRRLAAPAQDAAALAEALADPAVGDFAVEVLHNKSAQEIRLAVEDFFADRAAQDLLLLHFSCHGLKNAAGELFLAMADTRPTRLAATAVAADFVNRQMADSRAQRIALFLDCCYGGAFPRGMVVRAAGEAQVRDAFAGQENVGGGRGRVIVTASSAMEYAFEGAQLAVTDQPRPSVFTGAVVDGLTTGEADRDGDGWVGLTELVGFVTDRVHRVTPDQNPQMWTFGSQGELLIARSRVRRITPTPLAPELLEAVDSPLTATRFGVVDDLKERLLEADLGRAYSAWQVLQRMTRKDDSHKVQEAARRWVEAAVPRATPTELELQMAEDGSAVGELRLEGPPLAVVAVAVASAPWIRVEQAGAVVRVIARPNRYGIHEGAVVLSGPTGECQIPVRARFPMPEPQPEPEPPVSPEPRPTPPGVRDTQPPPSQPEWPPPEWFPPPGPEPNSTGEQADPDPSATSPPRVPAPPPWWLVAVLIVGALALTVLNWPGAEPRNGWYDESNTHWNVESNWRISWIWASITTLFAALVVRWTGRHASLVLGVVAGCATSLGVDGLVYLAGGLANNVGSWSATLLISAAMIAAIWSVVRPTVWASWSVHPVGAGLVLVGGALYLVSGAIDHNDGTSWFSVTKMGVVEPFFLAVLAWAALAAPRGSRSRAFLLATAATCVAFNVIDLGLGKLGTVISFIQGSTDSGSEYAYLTGLAASALVLAGIALGSSLRPDAAPRRAPMS